MYLNKMTKLTEHTSHRLRQHYGLGFPSGSLTTDYHYPWSPMTSKHFVVQTVTGQTRRLLRNLVDSATQIFYVVYSFLGWRC